MAVNQNQWDPILVGRCTNFRTYFSGDWENSLGVQDFDPWPNVPTRSSSKRAPPRPASLFHQR